MVQRGRFQVITPRSKDPEVRKVAQAASEVDAESAALMKQQQLQTEARAQLWTKQNAGEITDIQAVPDTDEIMVTFSSGKITSRLRDRLIDNIKALSLSIKKFGFLDGQDTVQYTLWMLNKGMKECIRSARLRGCDLNPNYEHADILTPGFLKRFQNQLRNCEKKWRDRA